MKNNHGWKFNLKLDGSLTSDRFCKFNSKLRIPVSGSILLSKEVREIIDTPEFQRLRGVRQLGPTMFVFPGATHTRFEHSLGVYSLTLRYVEKIFTLDQFKNEYDLSDRSIKLVILSALLHDIGHYPYSHWIEEIIEALPYEIKLDNHEKRARTILESPNFRRIIEKTWKVTIEEVADLISNTKGCNTLHNSFINSVLDSDKLDYLVRDSVHCGVNYGIGIDTDRIVDSLYINTKFHELCVTDKGRSALLSIISTRNIMYQEIYWHKTVRACEAMFKMFFFEYVKEEYKEDGEEEKLQQLNKLLFLSDDEFIMHLYKWAAQRGNERLVNLIKPFAYKGRNLLYKPVYIYFHHNANETKSTNRFFHELFKCNYEELVNKTKKLTKILQEEFVSDLDYFDVMLEITPIKEGEEYALDNFRIFNTQKKDLDRCPSSLFSLNTYLKDNRQAYIFCSPKYHERIRDLFLDEDTLNKILDKV